MRSQRARHSQVTKTRLRLEPYLGDRRREGPEEASAAMWFESSKTGVSGTCCAQVSDQCPTVQGHQQVRASKLMLQIHFGLFFSFFFFFFWLCWVFIAVLGLPLVVGEGSTLCCDARASHGGGFSCCRAWALGHSGFSSFSSQLSCSAACGIFPDQGSNLCLLHWRVDS